jgi:hypothetical protein
MRWRGRQIAVVFVLLLICVTACLAASYFFFCSDVMSVRWRNADECLRELNQRFPHGTHWQAVNARTEEQLVTDSGSYYFDEERKVGNIAAIIWNGREESSWTTDCINVIFLFDENGRLTSIGATYVPYRRRGEVGYGMPPRPGVEEKWGKKR